MNNNLNSYLHDLLDNLLTGLFNDDLDALESDLASYVEESRTDTRFAWHKFFSKDPTVHTRLLAAMRLEKEECKFNNIIYDNSSISFIPLAICDDCCKKATNSSITFTIEHCDHRILTTLTDDFIAIAQKVISLQAQNKD